MTNIIFYYIHSSQDSGDDMDEEERERPENNFGRALDTSKIMERIFDLENERILIKFHRVRFLYTIYVLLLRH